MKTYRRIEVTAFRRKVMISSGEFKLDLSNESSAPVSDEVRLCDADMGDAIEIESIEGQMMLAEAVRLLQQKLLTQPPDVYPCNNVTLIHRAQLLWSRFYNKLRALGRTRKI